MRTKSITRCMMLAFMMSFLMVGMAFAGVGGQGVPTYPLDVAVGETGIPVQLVFSNGNTSPFNLCSDVVSNVEHTPSCGDANSLLLCDNPDPGVFSVENADGVAIAATGVDANALCTAANSPFTCCTGSTTGNCNGCLGSQWTAIIDDVTTGRYKFTPTTTVTLAPGAFCVIQFLVDVVKEPTVDSQPLTGTQTDQLVSATYTTTGCTTLNGTPGAGQGSGFVTVEQGCIAVTKSCVSPTSCANPTITESVTVTNCGSEDLTGVTVTDSNATLTCSGTSLPVGGSAITCSGSFQGTPGSSTTDTVTATGTGALSAATFTASATATCSAPAAPAICVTKACTSASSCANPTISESVTVTNCGCGADLTGVTVTDSLATLTCSGTSLPCGSTTTCTSAASITCSGSYQGTVGASTTDTVTASATGAGQTVTATASATCSVPPASPAICVTKACTSASSCANPTISESITVTNCGTCADLTGVSCTDTLATLTCSGTSLPEGGSPITCSGSYQGTVGASTTDTVTCTATGAGQTVSATASATCSVPPASPAICVTKACTSPTSCTSPTINESVTVTNCGTCSDITGVSCTDTLATNLTCSGTSLPLGGSAITCTGSYQGTVGASTTDTVTCTGTGAGQTVSATASATCNVPPCVVTGCRMTGGQVTFCNDDASQLCTIPGGTDTTTTSLVKVKNGNKLDVVTELVKYTTGGQIGAPNETGCCDTPPNAKCINGVCFGGTDNGQNCSNQGDCPSSNGTSSNCPWGEWQHTHHQGVVEWTGTCPAVAIDCTVNGACSFGATRNGTSDFDFHSGTASAPPAAFIKSIICADEGWCVQARCAPDKQIFWDGTGVFHTVSNIDPQSLFGQCVTAQKKGNKPSIHYYRAHVGDFGEPGANNKQVDSSLCNWTDQGGVSIGEPTGVCPSTLECGFEAIDQTPDPKFGDIGGGVCAPCADWYEIEIHCTADPSSAIIYKVGNFITHGNFQIHPPVGSNCFDFFPKAGL